MLINPIYDRYFRAVFLLALLVGLQVACFAQSGSRPNIIFVLCDDLGYGDTGYFFQKLRQAANDRSEPFFITPKLDALAAEGLQLPHHYCPAPVCAPSRGSLLTGRHQGHANVRDNQFDKALEDNHTLGTVMKQAGYATACIGKWGVQGSGSTPAAWPAYPTKRGFDYFYGYVRHVDGHEHYPVEGGPGGGPKEVWENNSEVSTGLNKCYTTDLFTARAKKWIVDQRAANPAQPFFLYLSYDTPHAVLELPTQAYPAGGGLTGGLQWLGTPGKMINAANGTVNSYLHPSYAGATWDDDNNGATPEVAWKDVYKRYATDVRRIDDCVNDLVQTLKDLSIDNDTLIVFTSDNGPSKESYLPEPYDPNFFNSFGPFDGIKRDVWEGGIRVGAMVRWPGGAPGNRVNNLPCQFHDWLPTFADLAGVPVPALADGVSLVPTLANAGTQKSPQVYVEYFEGGSTPGYPEFLSAHRNRARKQMQAIRFGDLLGVRYNITSHADNFEIYNIVTDPQQSANLAAGKTALQQQMKDTVLRMRRPDSSAPRPYDNDLVPPLTPSPTTQGVLWKTYLGAYSWVPELRNIAHSASGMTTRPDVSVRPRDNDIGILFTGYINAPADGDYTFYVSADTGAVMRLHEAELIDADFGYASGSEASGTIKLKAGKHPYRLYYARRTAGTPALDLQWSGPGIAKQPVPDSAFLRDGSGPPGPPTAADDIVSTTQAVAVNISALANDSDDGTPQPLEITQVGTPQRGTAVMLGTTQIRYTPDPGFLGNDAFTYTISDGESTATATVRVNVYLHDGSYWFPFDQASGLVTEDASGGLFATLNNFTNDPAQWVAGHSGGALSFDGADDFVTIDGFGGITGADARSIAAWVKTTSTTSLAIVSWGPNTTGNKWTFLATEVGQIRVEITSGIIVGTRAINDGKWHHVACTFPGGASSNVNNVKLYVDGTPDAISTSSSRIVNTLANGDVKIGNDIQARYWNGQLDDVRIYPRSLSSGEIAALAASTNDAALAWHRRYLGTAPVNWLADDDQDGFPRLLEYALGGQPQVRENVLYAGPFIASDRFRWSIPRRKSGTTDLANSVEASRDMTNWDVPVSLVGTTPLDADFDTATYEATPAVSAETKLFFRLRAVLSP